MVAEFAAIGGVSGTQLDDIRTCASEAITNAVVHAFRDGRARGTITVSAEFTRRALIVVVSDDGIGFLPRHDSPGLGLGMPIISALSDSMSTRSAAGGGAEVSIAFNLADASPSSF